MQRCLELAVKGSGFVAPNPLVGAVLVYDNRIIGEGWHQKFGEAHAEVNCIAAVKENDRKLISQAVMYVSLEPCSHFGKTPPCTDLIIKNKIPKVIIGCSDPFKEVNGKGIEKLKEAGVEVELADRVLAYECRNVNKRFFTFHLEKRPYVILKWAQTSDGKIASVIGERLLISNEYTNRLVHKWRSEEAAILIGTNTALLDDPALTTRLWKGPSPTRMVIDMDLKLPTTLKIFNREVKTIIFNSIKQDEEGNLIYFKLKKNNNLISQLLNALYLLKIQSVIVEGGAKLLQSFIDEGVWDEMRVIKNNELSESSGLDAPSPVIAKLVATKELYTDLIETYVPVAPEY